MIPQWKQLWIDASKRNISLILLYSTLSYCQVKLDIFYKLILKRKQMCSFCEYTCPIWTANHIDDKSKFISIFLDDQ